MPTLFVSFCQGAAVAIFQAAALFLGIEERD